MNKRLTPQILGAYIGAECEIKVSRRSASHGFEDGIFRVNHFVIWIFWDEEVTGKLILRPLSSMTEDERAELGAILFGIDPYPIQITKGGSVVAILEMTHNEALDWLRSKGFDCGGRIEENGQTKWVPSLIDEGLAIEKNS